MVCHFDVADYRTCNHLDELGSVGSEGFESRLGQLLCGHILHSQLFFFGIDVLSHRVECTSEPLWKEEEATSIQSCIFKH